MVRIIFLFLCFFLHFSVFAAQNETKSNVEQNQLIDFTNSGELTTLNSTNNESSSDKDELSYLSNLKEARKTAEKEGLTDFVKLYDSIINSLNEHGKFNQERQKIEFILGGYNGLIKAFQAQIENLINKDPKIYDFVSIEKAKEDILLSDKKLVELSLQIDEEQNSLKETTDSVSAFPEKKNVLEKKIAQLETNLKEQQKAAFSKLNDLKKTDILMAIEANKEHLALLNIQQSSISELQELAQYQLDLIRKEYQFEDKHNLYLKQALVAYENEKVREKVETLIDEEEYENYPEALRNLTDQTIELSKKSEELSVRLKEVISQQYSVVSQIDLVNQAMLTLDEQAKWLKMSTGLGDMLRVQLSRLPPKTKVERFEHEVADLRLQRLSYDELLKKMDKTVDKKTLIESKIVNDEAQAGAYIAKVDAVKSLLTSLISVNDNLVTELTKLQISNNQLNEALDDVKNAYHKYFFWVPDIEPIKLNYPILILRDFKRIMSFETLNQLVNATRQVLKDPVVIMLLFTSFSLLFFSWRMKKRFHESLARMATKIGKVTYDNFKLTIKTVVFSLLFAIPLPFIWWSIGYALESAWDYPIAASLGYGIIAATPFLLVFMICSVFSLPKGLFIAHINWSVKNVENVMRYYKLSIWVVVPLAMMTVALNNYNDREYAYTLSRLSFMLLCIALIFVTRGVHNAKVPMYLNKKGISENLIDNFLWGILLIAPWLALFSSAIGYLSTSQALLARLEASVIIWFGTMLIYYIIRRFMFIQRRRIEFERAKQRRADRIAQRTKTEDLTQTSNSDATVETIEEPVIDLDVISAQSLQLIRSVLSLVAIISIIFLWSELHSAFAFLGKIKLWGSVSFVQDVEVVKDVTLASILMVIVVILVTTELVKNLPALLELGLLQHLSLSPGTGYAITTLSQYIVTLIGSFMSFSILGFEWSKVQWLAAAFGVGLGFGVQEIFANFISGLILLFEKPIRIGDTVTIRNLTGTITKINTRATTIIDWDRKEIVMPNKAFTTEQLINWTLSDSVIRVVLTVPATADTDSELIFFILKEAAKECSLILDEPNPEVFLIDIQEGIQLFELRVFASEISNRLPIRNQINQSIIKKYREHNLTLPFPPVQTRLDLTVLNPKTERRIFDSGGF